MPWNLSFTWAIHPSVLFFFSVVSILRQALPSRWQEYSQQLHAVEQGLANYSSNGWPPGFIKKTVLNIAMPICVYLWLFSCPRKLSICNRVVRPIKPKVFRICLYGKGLLTPAGEARFCWGLIFESVGGTTYLFLDYQTLESDVLR